MEGLRTFTKDVAHVVVLAVVQISLISTVFTRPGSGELLNGTSQPPDRHSLLDVHDKHGHRAGEGAQLHKVSIQQLHQPHNETRNGVSVLNYTATSHLVQQNTPLITVPSVGHNHSHDTAFGKLLHPGTVKNTTAFDSVIKSDLVVTPESPSSPEFSGSPESHREITLTTATLSNNETTSSTESSSKTHLHLRAAEIKECINQTVVEYISCTIYYGCLYITKAKVFYKDVHSLMGSIVWEYNRTQTRRTKSCTHVDTFHNLNYVCYCALRIRVLRGFYLAIEILEHAGFIIDIYDAGWRQRIGWSVNTTNLFEGSLAIVSYSNEAVIILEDRQHGKPEYRKTVIQFKSLPGPGLRVRRIAFNRGVVQTPLYRNKFTSLLNQRPEYWAYVDVPSGHVIMVSSRDFDTMRCCLALLAEGNDTMAQVCQGDNHPPQATLYNVSSLLVHLYEVNTNMFPAFQLQFSFHCSSVSPVKLSNDTWNCSVPHSADFLYHLLCNVAVECDNAADEVHCSYTSHLCGPGYLTLGGACFSYVRSFSRKLTSKSAASVCLVRGERLATLNTEQKWKDAIRVLPFYNVFVGLYNTPSTYPLWYKTTFQWADYTTALYLYSSDTLKAADCTTQKTCGFMELSPSSSFGVPRSLFAGIAEHISCVAEKYANVLCEKTLPRTPIPVQINGSNYWPPETAAYVKCPLGYYTHPFLVYDAKTYCRDRDELLVASNYRSSQFVPFFTCTERKDQVPYTLVCDHRTDCVDGSDEDFCQFPPCRLWEYTCESGQCILMVKVDDGWKDCSKGDDEVCCTVSPVHFNSLPPPALVDLTNRGRLQISGLTEPEGMCPHTHFQCHKNGYCLPVFLRCNGVYDCPGREDEAGCESCPGFYRCRHSRVCLVHSYLCDGYSHCPQHDDELLCNATCPPFCLCQGLAFSCRRIFRASHFFQLRYLDASGSGMTPVHLTDNVMLVYLSLADCGLTRLRGLSLMNLLSLNITDNNLYTLSHIHLDRVPQLRNLFLSRNPLTLEFDGADGIRRFPSILRLDLSRIVMHVLNVTALSAFPSLQVLNLSHSGVRRVHGDGFSIMKQLREIDLRGCPLTVIPRGIFRGLTHLRVVYTQSFTLCCPAVLPLHFNAHNCFAPKDEISSCEDLLRGNGYRVCVFLLSLLAMTGNAVSFVFRTRVSKRGNKLGYGIFVTHLSVSDFLMGVYLIIIGAADQIYHGSYLWHEVTWRHSVVCQFSGFLSLLSSEVSALIMCLITIDRFLVLRFPFSRLHFRPASAHLASFVVWTVFVVAVSVPLLPAVSHWEFYSQTGICIPLPVTRTYFFGYDYSFGILIVFNFVVFIFISVGQLSIYWTVRANAMSVSNTTKKTKDLSIARRLITVAMTDFLCWFPIGVVGLLASKGVPMPGEVNVAVAILVLPLNSAINPCLYTLNIILERRKRVRVDKLRALLLAQVKNRLIDG